MNIEKNIQGNTLEIALEGRLDTTTAPQFDAAIKENIDGITDLVINFAKLDYISSAGLRVLLTTQKKMNKQGKMTIKNANKMVMGVFEVTGFAGILTIE